MIGEKVVEVDLPLQDGDSLRSRIKQVASGRFGVTAEYLVTDEVSVWKQIYAHTQSRAGA